MALINNVRTLDLNGKQITIFLLPASKGLVMAKKLSQLFLPTLSGFAEIGEEDSDMSLSTVSTLLVESLDDLDVMSVVSTLLNSVTVNGQPIDFDTYFMANYGELVSVIKFAVEENFSSFFEGKGLGNLLKSKLPVMQGIAE